jgi:hypothetical protein
LGKTAGAGLGRSKPATGLALAIVNGAAGLDGLAFLGFMMCFAEITGLGGSKAFTGVALIGINALTVAAALAGFATITLAGDLGGVTILVSLSSPSGKKFLPCVRLMFTIGAVVD